MLAGLALFACMASVDVQRAAAGQVTVRVVEVVASGEGTARTVDLKVPKLKRAIEGLRLRYSDYNLERDTRQSGRYGSKMVFDLTGRWTLVIEPVESKPGRGGETKIVLSIEAQKQPKKGRHKEIIHSSTVSLRDGATFIYTIPRPKTMIIAAITASRSASGVD